MLKKLLVALMLLLPFGVGAQTLKFGKVNKSEVFELMSEKKAADVALIQISGKYEEEYNTLREEFNRKYLDYQQMANDVTTPATIKERRMQEIQENNKKIESFLETIEIEYKRQEEELLAPVIEKLNQTIAAVSKENGFLIVFDSKEEGVAYMSDELEDITPMVMAALGIDATKSVEE